MLSSICKHLFSLAWHQHQPASLSKGCFRHSENCVCLPMSACPCNCMHTCGYKLRLQTEAPWSGSRSLCDLLLSTSMEFDRSLLSRSYSFSCKRQDYFFFFPIFPLLSDSASAVQAAFPAPTYTGVAALRCQGANLILCPLSLFTVF